MDLLEDVATRSELAKLILPTGGERPRVRRHAFGQPKRLEVLEASQ
jgi:hypothetical protein